MQKTEWDRPFLKILTFWSKSKFNLVKAFSFFLFFFFFFNFFNFFYLVSSGLDRVRMNGSNRVDLDKRVKPG